MTVRTRIKFCGITRVEDLDAAVEAGADAIGLNAYDRSPRFVGPETAARLAARLPPFITPVLVLVDATRDAIGAYLDLFPAYTLQFHGDETAEDCEQFGNPFIKVARIAAGVEHFDLEAFAERYTTASAILVDAHVEGYGGEGRGFDWNVIGTGPTLRPLILSGGLRPETVGAGIAQLRPWAVDVSSGIERTKGIKDASKMRGFVDAVRTADRLAGSGP
ncbi:phosphoribosylanthranilate isomerase [soil metagenome]